MNFFFLGFLIKGERKVGVQCLTDPLIQKGSSDDTPIRARGCLLLGGKHAPKMTACLVSINPASAMGVGSPACPRVSSSCRDGDTSGGSAGRGNY
jgi:hypothetical protein